MTDPKEKTPENEQDLNAVEVEVNVDSESSAKSEKNKKSDKSVKALEEALAQETAKAKDSWERLLRKEAEYQNLLKRSKQDIENAHKYGAEKLVKELLTVMDSIERGLETSVESEGELNPILKGMEMTYKIMLGILEKHGVVQLDPIGKPFDPEFHEAMTLQEAHDVEPNTNILVVQKGYTLNGRLVRPASVIVSSAATTAKAEDSDKAEEEIQKLTSDEQSEANK